MKHSTGELRTMLRTAIRVPWRNPMTLASGLVISYEVTNRTDGAVKETREVSETTTFSAYGTDVIDRPAVGNQSHWLEYVYRIAYY